MDLLANKWRTFQVVLPINKRHFLFSDSIYLVRDVGYQGSTRHDTIEAVASLVA